MSTIECALYSTFTAKCSLNPPDYATSSLVPVKFNIFTFLLMQASISHWTCIRCDWWFIDKSTRVIYHVCCQIQRTMFGLLYVDYGPGQIQYNYISCYSVCNIPLNVNPSILVIWRQFHERHTPHLQPYAEDNMRFCAMSNLALVKSNIISSIAIQAAIFNWT
jgi:hypothetical protein